MANGILDRLSSGGLKVAMSPEEKEAVNQTIADIEKYSKDVQERSMADRLANEEMKYNYISSFKPKLDLTQPLSFFSGWTGNQAPIASYKPPQEDISQRLAMAEKLYSTNTKETDKAVLDSLREKLKAQMDMGKPMAGLGALLSRDSRNETEDRLVNQKLDDRLIGLDDKIQKDIVKPYAEIQDGIGQFNNALATGDKSTIDASVQLFARRALAVKGDMSDSERNAVTLDKRSGEFFNKLDELASGNATVDPSRIEDFKRLVGTIETNAKNVYSKKLDASQSNAENYAWFKDAKRSGRVSEDPFEIKRYEFGLLPRQSEKRKEERKSSQVQPPKTEAPPVENKNTAIDFDAILKKAKEKRGIK